MASIDKLFSEMALHQARGAMPALLGGVVVGLVVAGGLASERWLASASIFILFVSVWVAAVGLRRRQQAVRDAGQSRALLHNVINSSPDGIALFEAVRDDAGKTVELEFLLGNHALETLTGVHADEDPGRRLSELQPELAGESLAKLCDVVDTGNPVSIEFRQGPDQNGRWLCIRAVKLDECLVMNVMDVTDRKLASEELSRAKASAEHASSLLEQALAAEQASASQAREAERAKGQFLAITSHEIRTPMNGVLGFAELLEQTDLQPNQREYVETILSSAKALLRIIDDVLDFTRIQSGAMEIEKAPFDLLELVEGVQTLLEPRAAQKGIELRLELGEALPSRVVADAGRVRQVLLNLAGNAVKFTDCGHVLIRIRNTPTTKAGYPRQLEFCVEDTGIGIPPEKLRSIFDPFVQADSSIARQYGGSGLGLTISHRLVELMGGSLIAECRPAGGSRFAFVLPFDTPSQSTDLEVPHRAEPLDGQFAQRNPLRILVADDDPTNLKLIQRILSILGYQPLCARDGRQAVDLFKRNRPDCILIDKHMPELDGLEATRQIREFERCDAGAKRVFVATLTADALPDGVEPPGAALFDEYLTKPFDLSQIARMLEQASRRATVASAGDTRG